MTDYARMFRLDGKVAVVTGGAQGIGAETGRALAQVGAAVLLTDVNDAAGNETAERIRAQGGQAEFLRQDVTDEAQWEAVIAQAKSRFGGLDILVNNAGIERMGLLGDVEVETFREVLDTNVVGVFLGCKHAMRAMRRDGGAGRGGSIINISSVAGLIGVTALGAYNASKGAVRLLTKSVAVECAQFKTGIRCNSIHPGVIHTDMGQKFLQNFVDLGLTPDVPTIDAAFKAVIPYGEYGEVRDIACAVLYLATDASRYMSGAEIVVDGGWTAT
ncbi:glucose 1-dehydrogenase [Hydrocarboniphaga effusa]|uniref:SDR family NAD(P)-dependent oxidoreductase n=1 Tax=Hydrocarboniphaga effusa TaxID=243629 RepID=UPI0031380683